MIRAGGRGANYRRLGPLLSESEPENKSGPTSDADAAPSISMFYDLIFAKLVGLLLFSLAMAT